MIDNIFLDVDFITGKYYDPFDENPSDKIKCLVQIRLFLNSKPCDTFISYDVLNYKKEDWIHTYPDSEKDFTFYPFTCDCDVPGCNGFHTAVDITYTPEYITWNFDDSERKAINIAGKQHFIFSRKNYEQSAQKVIDKIKEESLKWDSSLFLLNDYITWKKAYSFFKK